MTKERDDYKTMLDRMVEGGTLSVIDTGQNARLAEYDALIATKRLPHYALLSTIVAAISAIASAAAAYFAYAVLHMSH
jgi:hypothetical protein